MRLEPRNVLEIGIGNGLLSYMLGKAGLDVTTLDFDASLQPDVVASVTDMSFDDGSFDVVAAFEVLEHIPYEEVPKALSEVHRVCRRAALISLPDARTCLRIRIPGLGRRQFLVEWPFWRPRDHRFNGEHYWEINTNGHPLKSILHRISAAGFNVERTFRPWEMPYHRFFRLAKTDAEGANERGY